MRGSKEGAEVWPDERFMRVLCVTHTQYTHTRTHTHTHTHTYTHAHYVCVYVCVYVYVCVCVCVCDVWSDSAREGAAEKEGLEW